ncbi:cobalamin biosynthesis Mg chelatase CobN [Paenibacillus rhizosphaerae]|uniref:Cobalamin biosynthesis Mg chelatase CobN n=1 Tax=Paenibacillus rhizosphaerae TaxID=297318 RepID=A0A839TSC4_9BACL|nr:hypothetical protein [Paenibacillus rhizosphaerae]MBB3127627.1 cobalamin biosynthesis Mg chelatase CobN [Paenibacillus rhizosphaerae]
MNSELSRVETYRKNRKKTPVKKASSAGAGKRTSSKSKAAATSSTRAAGTLRRGKTAGDAGKRPAAAKTAAAASGSAAAPQTRRNYRTAGKRETGDETAVPARADTYGSRRIKISKYFTNSLIFLFIGLTAFLVYWGIKGAPPLEDLW